MDNKKILILKEENCLFNKWGSLECSTDHSQILATSQFFYPLDVSYYINLIREGRTPLVATEIWPSSFCNHHCNFCSSAIYGLKTKTKLSTETLLNLINDLALLGNKLVRFSGGGEPFTHGGLGKIAEEIAEKGMLSLFITNGSLLTKSIIKTLVDNATVVRFSFNGGTKKDYHAIHGVDHFDKVRRNMILLSSERSQKLKEESLLLGATFIVTPLNFRHVYEAAKVVKECGFDFFLIRGINPVRYCFNDSDRQVLYTQLQKAHELKDNHFLLTGSTTRLDGRREKKKLSPRCYVPDYRIFINSDGNAYPCFSGIMSGLKPYGNIYRTGIVNVWGNKTHSQFRSKMQRGLLPFMCDHFCDHIEFNSFIDWVKDKYLQDKQVMFRKVSRSWTYNFISQLYLAWL